MDRGGAAPPPAIPFQVTPGSVEQKKDGTWRLVWNASWPRPDTVNVSVKVDDGEWTPVSSNANTRLPEYLNFEWGSIEANNEMLAILAECAERTGLPLLGKTFNIKKCFRQLTLCQSERWKCITYVMGGFREDKKDADGTIGIRTLRTLRTEGHTIGWRDN